MHAASHPGDVRFSIREYSPADFDALWHLDQLCFPEGISYTRPELNSFISRRNAVTLVAEHERNSQSNIAGFVVAHAIREKYGRVVTLDVVPEVRRHGLATTLMHACEERLRAAGCREVYLETAVDNRPALRLYVKLGYEVLGVLPEYYTTHSLDAFQMGKRL